MEWRGLRHEPVTATPQVREIVICRSGNLLKKTSVAKSRKNLTNRPVEPVFGANGVAVIESHHSTRFFMDWRKDAFPKWILIFEGQGAFHLRDRTHQLRAPVLISVPEGTEHRLEDNPADPLTLYALCLRRKVFPSQELLDAVFGNSRIIEDRLFVDQAFSALRRIVVESRQGGIGSQELSLSLAMQLVVGAARLTEQTSTTRTAEARILAYGRELEQAFWIDERMDAVAARMGMSRRSFSGLFRKHFGKSWLDFIHDLRIHHAARLLKESALPIKTIAFECGYQDISHFYRRFSLQMKMSPQNWRKAAARISHISAA
jgi:AraC family L-rhamnose operon regulatory protein RhaS